MTNRRCSVTVSLDTETVDILDEAAKAMGNRSKVVEALIEEHCQVTSFIRTQAMKSFNEAAEKLRNLGFTINIDLKSPIKGVMKDEDISTNL